MSDRRRQLGMSVVLAVFGLGSLFSMFGRPGFAAIRTVDVVQLIGTGMCFGAAIVALVTFLRSPHAR
jgi:hypothetical protein